MVGRDRLQGGRGGRVVGDVELADVERDAGGIGLGAQGVSARLVSRRVATTSSPRRASSTAACIPMPLEVPVTTTALLMSMPVSLEVAS